MKKIYEFFSLEFHLILLLILSFLSYLFPISYRVLITGEKIPTYGFNFFGSFGIVLLITIIILLFVNNITPQRFKKLWSYLMIAYCVTLFINIIVSIFYSRFVSDIIYEGKYHYITGNGYIPQFIVFVIAFIHMINIYNESYVLFDESGIKKLINNN